MKLTFFCFFLLIGHITIGQNTGNTRIMPDGKTYPSILIDGIEHLIINGDTVKYLNEVLPEFPGGKYGLHDYLRKNIKYPKTARKDKVAGVVVVEFNINEDGKVDSARVIRGVRKDLDEVGLGLIKGMPRWRPATQNDVPVKVKFTLPLVFKL